MFLSTDPRHTIYKPKVIVIYRKTSPPGEAKICLGFCDTKHEYFVSTDFPKPYHHLSVNDDWPEGWYWEVLSLDDDVQEKVEKSS